MTAQEIQRITLHKNVASCEKYIDMRGVLRNSFYAQQKISPMERL